MRAGNSLEALYGPHSSQIPFGERWPPGDRSAPTEGNVNAAHRHRCAQFSRLCGTGPTDNVLKVLGEIPRGLG